MYFILHFTQIRIHENYKKKQKSLPTQKPKLIKINMAAKYAPGSHFISIYQPIKMKTWINSFTIFCFFDHRFRFGDGFPVSLVPFLLFTHFFGIFLHFINSYCTANSSYMYRTEHNTDSVSYLSYRTRVICEGLIRDPR